MNKIKRTNSFKKFSLVSLLSLGLLFSNGLAKTYPIVRVKLGLEYSPSLIAISEVPEMMRSIPKHPDDGGGPPIELKQDSLKTEYWNMPFFSFGVRLEDSTKVNRGEITWDTDLNCSGQRVMYNYVSGGTGRGMGAALIYYELNSENYFLSWTNFSLLDHLTSGLSLSYTRRVVNPLFLSVKAQGKFYQLVLENGWDRHDHDQVKSKFPIAGIFQGKISAGLGFNFGGEDSGNEGFLNMNGGVLFNKFLRKDPSLEVRISPAKVFLGIALGNTFGLED